MESYATPQQPADAASTNGEALRLPAALPVLNVAGLVVTRADLVAALRLWVPQVADVEPLADGRFVLTLARGAPADEGKG